MNLDVRQKLVESLFDPEDEKYLDEAIENINKRTRKDITTPEEVKRWEYIFDISDDEPIDIDYAIAELKMFKENGYTFIDYDGDHDDDLIACCYDKETPTEHAHKIRVEVQREINMLKYKVNSRQQKLDKLAVLKKQISELEKELNNED